MTNNLRSRFILSHLLPILLVVPLVTIVLLYLLETQVLIADGETAVIGGLTEEGTQESEAGTPGLSSIPGLGWLFKQRSKSTVRQELMIFLTPKIVSVL